MGRIKTALIKRTTLDLIHEHGSEFTADFEQNKLLVSRFVEVSSKKLRNIIAGYCTRLSKTKD